MDIPSRAHRRLLRLFPLLALSSCFALGCGDDAGDADSGAVYDAGPKPDTGAPIDAGPQGDTGSGADASGPDAETNTDAAVASTGCEERGALIVAATGRTITVSPAANGQVMADGALLTLRQVVSNANMGDTILLEDGTYTFPSGGAGSFTGLYFTTPGITLRSRSGDPSAVVLDSAYADHGNSSAPITVAASDVVLADFSVRRSVFHLIHLWADGDNAVIHNVHLIDGGQQFLKASPGGGQFVDGVEVSCSQFRMTSVGRDNVWGYGPSDGSTTCYTGGIDAHDSRNWVVHDNYFEGIYCNAGGVARPVHGMNPEARGNQTYTGGLSEHAIHIWDSEQGSGHVIERNRIVNCARGIGLGLRAEVYGTIIRNNTIFSEFAGSREHDVGISLERAHDTHVFNNTVFFSSNAAYANAIEYRWDTTAGLEIRNNLTNKLIRERNGASAQLSANVTSAVASWFVDTARGDLHLASCDEPSVVGAGDVLREVSDDVDGQSRGAANDIGADDCAAD